MVDRASPKIVANEFSPGVDDRDPRSSTEGSDLTSTRPNRKRWRLRILIALNVLLAVVFVFSQLERHQIKTLGPTGQIIYDVLNPPAVEELSPAGRRLFADVKALGGQANVMQHVSAFQRLFGQSEQFSVLLSGSDFNDQALARLTSQYGDQIWGLFIRNLPVSNDGLRCLKGLSHLQNLAIGNEDMKHFASRNAPISTITDAGLAHLKGLVELTSLNLDGLPITDEGLETLSDLSNLGGLYLSRTKIKGSALTQLKSLPKLAVLYLDDTELTDQGLSALAGATNLQFLSLVRVPLTAERLNSLKNLPLLRQLDITGCGLLDEEVDAFRKSMPGLKIERR